MKYEIIRSENEKELLEDIEQRLDSITWCKDYNKQIMFVPVGIVSREGKVGIVLHTNTDLLIEEN